MFDQKVKVYTTTTCIFCKPMLRALERLIGVENFEVVDVSDHQDRMAIAKKSGFSTVPVLEKEGKYLAGFDYGKVKAFVS